MNQTELISKLKYGKIAVHCKTNKEAKEFLKLCDESCNNYDKEYCEKYCDNIYDGIHLKWTTDENILDDTYFRIYKDKTHYMFNRKEGTLTDFYLYKGNPEYCEDRSLEVIEWSDISNKLDDKIGTPIRGKRAEMKIIDEKADLF